MIAESGYPGYQRMLSLKKRMEERVDLRHS
jgi:hypothetical protein